MSFNSRPHTEVDAFPAACRNKIHNLSTHDLTRRSTRNHPRSCLADYLSTHDLTRRSTCPTCGMYAGGFFQLTTSHGGRLFVYTDTEVIMYTFNSRPHTEVDLTDNTFLDERYVFQLTTSHGGRRYYVIEEHAAQHLSTHDLTRRSTDSTDPSDYAWSTFNSRPHTEVD